MSTLRDDHPTCPTCQRALALTPDGKRHACEDCKGLLVSDAELIEVVRGILLDPPEQLPLEPPAKQEPARQCPRCAAMMTQHALYGIQIDRCEAHGVWFDGDELRSVLEKLEKSQHQVPLGAKIAFAATTTAYIAFSIIRFIWFMPR